MDVSQYLEIFIEETKEHIQAISDQMLVMEKEPENADAINDIFRAAHSLKGMAATMGFKRMQKLTHEMENVLSEIRNGDMSVTAGLVDVLFRCIDALEQYLDMIQNTSDEGEEENNDIIAILNDILNGGSGDASDGKEPVLEEVKKVEAAQIDNDKAKYKNIAIRDTERQTILEGIEDGLKVFGVTVYLAESCILKSARAYLIFKVVEELGTMIHSDPEMNDIEDERFEYDFSMIILTRENEEKVVGDIMNVSEVKEVVAEELIFEEENEEEENQENKSEANTATATAAQKAPASSAGSPAGKTGKPVTNRSVRVDIEKLDVLMNLVSELIIAKNGLVAFGSEGNHAATGGFGEQIEYLERITTNLHESVMKVRMVPIESVVNRFPRLIRDLNKKLNKKMELYMTGEDTELDRTVIDEIGDPLMHMLRNSADHGLESNEERLKVGKPEVGSIFLDAYQDGNNVIIEVRDDGRGIDVEKVRQSAIEKGTVSADLAAQMNDKEIIDLLFRPSFSTAKEISDVSGRGVGLDVVKTKIEALGGDIEVKSELGVGSTFSVRLPLTLAIIQALVVELGEEKYAIPLSSINNIEDVDIHDIKYVRSEEVINLRGTVIPLLRLDEILDSDRERPDSESITVVIVSKGDRLAGLVVDNLIGQQEIVIKPLGKFIDIDKIISGASIQGDGEIALILDVNALV